MAVAVDVVWVVVFSSGVVLWDQSIIVGVGWSKIGGVVRLDSVFRKRRSWALFTTSVSTLFNFMQSNAPRKCVAPVDHSERRTPQAPLSKETVIPRSSRRPHTCLGAQNL